MKTVGVTQYTQKGHIARAALEAACFQTKAILDAMEKDSGQALRRLAVDGGMSNSDLCMQVCHTATGRPGYFCPRLFGPCEVFLSVVLKMELTFFNFFFMRETDPIRSHLYPG
jgi:hypothetical protein